MIDFEDTYIIVPMEAPGPEGIFGNWAEYGCGDTSSGSLYVYGNLDGDGHGIGFQPYGTFGIRYEDEFYYEAHHKPRTRALSK